MASSYPMLRYGSSGQEVRRLQQALNRAGYSLEVDGGFGEKTRAALMDYQCRAGMTPDGVAGSKTWASLGLQSAQDRLADLEKGYTPSRETQEARRSWEELAARQPGDYTSPYADLIQFTDDKTKLRDNQIHTDLLLKQIIRPVRPAKLTAPAGFQVFADGAHRHKVPVFAVQQTLVVCLLEQPTGIRQLLLLLGNELVKILCVSEGPLIGGFFILDELRIPCQFLPVFLCQLLVGIGYIRYTYEQVHENIQSNNDKQRDVSLFIQAQHGGKVYHSDFFRQSQHKHGNKNNNCDEQSPTKPTPLFYE